MVKGSKHTEKTKRKIALSRKPYQGKKHPRWKGGQMLIDGYVYIWNKKHPSATKMGYVCEHRLVIEKKFGRYLKRHEVVHHINGIKTDNREENLVICQSTGKHFVKNHLRGRDKLGKFL